MSHVPSNPGQSSAFPATDWTVVQAAGAEEPDANHAATIRICELYWQPIYHFVRRTWPAKSADEALEATHEFFTRRLEKHDIKHLDPKKGLFRNWLRGAVSNFVRNARRSSLRERVRLANMETGDGDEPTTWEPRTALDPWLQLEHELALAILERALAKLELEHAARGGAEFVREVRPLLVPGEGKGTYAALEQRWGLSSGTLKVRLHTMRRRLGTLICLELGVPPEDDPNDDGPRERELAWLFQASSLKEEQPCPKAKALARQPSTASTASIAR